MSSPNGSGIAPPPKRRRLNNTAPDVQGNASSPPVSPATTSAPTVPPVTTNTTTVQGKSASRPPIPILRRLNACQRQWNIAAKNAARYLRRANTALGAYVGNLENTLISPDEAIYQPPIQDADLAVDRYRAIAGTGDAVAQVFMRAYRDNVNIIERLVTYGRWDLMRRGLVTTVPLERRDSAS